MSSEKLAYQVDQIAEKVEKLNKEIDALDGQVNVVEKSLLVVQGNSVVLEKTVEAITSRASWLFKVITAGVVTAIIAWIVAGGLVI
tara:strand:- start:182 stop:439 length:258 start_codon:yes stop_codon:yes gene_type:complete